MMGRTSPYAGADWIRESLGVEMSDFGRDVANILGDAWYGIYHLPAKQLRKVDWNAGAYIVFHVQSELATFDFLHLTTLVIAAHERGIRMSVRGLAPGWLELMFHPRYERNGPTSQRHPSIAQAIEKHRKVYGDCRFDAEPEVNEETAAFDEWAGRVSTQPPGGAE